MGWLQDILGAAAPIAGGIFGGPVGAAIGGGIGGLLSNNSAANATKDANQAAIDAAKMDPRNEAMIYGQNGQGGLLQQYQALGQQPQNQQLAQYGQSNLDYLGNAPGDMGAIRDAALGQLKPGAAPQANVGAYAVGNQVNAPAQNAMDLSGSYDKFINGAPGANPFLTGAIQKGINQSTNAFNQMQDTATSNLMKNVLPSIRSNSVLAGQYGGSRQGVAEGNAIGDYAKAAQQAASQFGQGNTDAAIAAQAGAYDTDLNRALAATQGLGAQQYGVAGQNAATKNQAEFMNVGNTQQTNLANLGAQQNQNTLNAANVGQGAGLLAGQLGGAAGAGQNQANYALNQATQVNGLLQPYLTKNNNAPPMQPTYANSAGAALGGATAGLSLYNAYNQLSKPQGYGGNPGTNNPGAGANGMVDWSSRNPMLS